MPRRVLLVNDHLGWGGQVHGVTRLFELWATHLDPARYGAAVCILRRQPHLADGLRAAGVPVFFLGKSKYDPTTLLALWRLARRERIDLLHVQAYGATTFGRVLGFLTRRPVVVHFHDTTPNYPWPQWLADRALGFMTHAYVAVSRSVRDWWARRCGLAPERVEVLHNCTSLARFRVPDAAQVEAARGRLGLARGALVVGTVTRLFEEKGTRYLVEAARQVAARRPDVAFVVVGDGPLRRPLEELALGLGLRDKFVFTGYAPDVASILPAFDVFALTSYFAEGGAPLPVLEAMATGTPVVVTDLVEIVEHERTGLVVPRQDVTALATALFDLLESPGKRRRLAGAALEAVKQHDAPAYAQRLMALYDRLFDP